MNGGLKNWETHPRTALAKVLLLDQFTRNVYRKTGKAFEGDVEALRIAKMALNRWPEYYHPIEKMFLILPFMHAEMFREQDLSVKYMIEITEEARMNEHMDDDVIAFLEKAIPFAEKHKEIIQRYGRFPTRNQSLGRENSPEEERFLEEADGWGQ